MADQDADKTKHHEDIDRRKFLQMVGGGVAAAGAAAALKPATANAGTALQEVPFGLVCSVTGPMALLGKKLINGAQMRIDEINAAGGVAKKFRLKLVNEDDEGKPEIAAAMAQKMASAKVQLVMTTSASTLDLAMNPTLKRGKIVMLISNNTNPRITLENEFAFRTCFTNRLEGWGSATFMYNNLKVRNLGIMRDMSNEGHTAIANSVRENFLKLGGKVGADESYSGMSGAEKDFKPQLGKLKSAGVEAVMCAGYVQEGGLIVKQITEIGFKPKYIIGNNAWEDESLFKIAGKELQQDFESYITTFFASDDPDPDYQAWHKRYKARFNIDPFAYDALSYDTTTIGVWALEKAGKYDGDAMRNALMALVGPKATPLKGLLTAKAGFSYDNNRDAIKPVVVNIIKNNTFSFAANMVPPPGVAL